ncbi:MAG: proline dehydrogenase [Pseudonocardiales bacterium]|nr:MAG: proline dehydrogenase [Pseudonocardiales bacterium]
MLRSVILAAAGNERIKHLAVTAPVSRALVARFVAGEAADDAVRVATSLAGAGLQVSLDRLGEDTTTRDQATATAATYVELLRRIADDGLATSTEVSVKLSALGQRIDQDLTLDNATAICAAADAGGTTVTLDMENHTTTDLTLDTLSLLRKDFPATGAVLQAYLRRTEGDCQELATAGSRVRLCKGAYAEPASVAYQRRDDVDRSYVRCVNILMAGAGRPMLATHDPRLVEIGAERASRYGRAPGSYELQMLYGIRPDEQKRLVAAGQTVRVYVPYGDQWYGYLMRRLAERPANLGFFLRSVATRS